MSALDSVLDTLKGPKTVSTVAKSNYDWETFKEKVTSSYTFLSHTPSYLIPLLTTYTLPI